MPGELPGICYLLLPLLYLAARNCYAKFLMSLIHASSVVCIQFGRKPGLTRLPRGPTDGPRKTSLIDSGCRWSRLAAIPVGREVLAVRAIPQKIFLNAQFTSPIHKKELL